MSATSRKRDQIIDLLSEIESLVDDMHDDSECDGWDYEEKIIDQDERIEELEKILTKYTSVIAQLLNIPEAFVDYDSIDMYLVRS